MSECVVRMEMPKHCYHCDLRYECDAFYAPGKRKPFDKGCMIVCQLPEGHGRLVDMKDIDSMMEDASSTSDESGLYSLVYRDDLDFDGLPTIVPADTAERNDT